MHINHPCITSLSSAKIYITQYVQHLTYLKYNIHTNHPCIIKRLRLAIIVTFGYGAIQLQFFFRGVKTPVIIRSLHGRLKTLLQPRGRRIHETRLKYFKTGALCYFPKSVRKDTLALLTYKLPLPSYSAVGRGRSNKR